MIDPAVLDAMLAAGASAEVIVAAVKADQAKEEVRRERKRAGNAERQQRYRDRNNANNALRDVTNVTPPALDKETLPPTPPIKEINPTPRARPASALVRKAAGFGPPEGVVLDRWNEFCAQRKKPLTATAYAAITNKLADGKRTGWPPGEVVDRAIESSWETVHIPRENRNAEVRRNCGSPSRPGDGFIRALHEAAGFGAADHPG